MSDHVQTRYLVNVGWAKIWRNTKDQLDRFKNCTIRKRGIGLGLEANHHCKYHVDELFTHLDNPNGIRPPRECKICKQICFHCRCLNVFRTPEKQDLIGKFCNNSQLVLVFIRSQISSNTNRIAKIRELHNSMTDPQIRNLLNMKTLETFMWPNARKSEWHRHLLTPKAIVCQMPHTSLELDRCKWASFRNTTAVCKMDFANAEAPK